MSAVLQPHGSGAPPLRRIDRCAALGTTFHGPLPDPQRVARSGPCARLPGQPSSDRWRRGDAPGVCSGRGRRPGMQPLAAFHGGHQSGGRAGQPGDGRVVPRDPLAETAIRRAGQGGHSEVERLHRVLARPCDDPADPAPADRADAGFPPARARSIEVSCSS